MRNKLINLANKLLKLSVSISSEDWIALYDAYEDYLNPDSRMYDKQKINSLLDPFIINLIWEIRETNDERLVDDTTGLHQNIEDKLVELEYASSIEEKMMWIDIIKDLAHHTGSLIKYFSKEPSGMQQETFKYISNRENKNKEYIKTKYYTPEAAYDYARDVLKDRYPEGEKAIATSAEYSYLYAKNVIGGIFPEGEAAIATSAEYSYRYAINLLQDRFPEGEPAIATSAHISYYYAKMVIKGKFPEGEKVIATDVEYSVLYANEVIKGSFPEGEPIIATDAYYSELYARIVLHDEYYVTWRTRYLQGETKENN